MYEVIISLRCPASYFVTRRAGARMQKKEEEVKY